ncbi:MAG: PEP-CTERM sorting domain-containing protein [Janthinobacterium lividum]
MFSRILFSLFALLLVVKAPTASATVIGTTGSANTSVGYFGSYATPSFGESFVSPGGMLTSVSFSSINVILGSNVRLVIAPIAGTTPGSALYSAQYGLVDGTNTFSNLSVNTTAGTNYFAYLTTFGVNTNPVKLATFGGTLKNSYSGGEFLYDTSDCDPAGDKFSSAFTPDLAFSATFAPSVAVTPEPSSLVLLASGMLSAGTMLRRRKQVIA